MKNRVILSAVALAVTASLTQSAFATEASIGKAMRAAGEAVFNHRCKACHSLDRAKNAFGPSLYGVVGRESGTLPRFDYSKAMKNSNLTWNEENIRHWVANNEKFIPNTRMRHMAITDPAEQDFLLAFLKSLK